jgi:hypothetical protein
MASKDAASRKAASEGRELAWKSSRTLDPLRRVVHGSRALTTQHASCAVARRQASTSAARGAAAGEPLLKESSDFERSCTCAREQRRRYGAKMIDASTMLAPPPSTRPTPPSRIYIENVAVTHAHSPAEMSAQGAHGLAHTHRHQRSHLRAPFSAVSKPHDTRSTRPTLDSTEGALRFHNAVPNTSHKCMARPVLAAGEPV